ncbi:methionyl-tRNA formyltransferase [Methanohalophilus profundi]|uniref:methionyl-tRNA formyltransferase n=1 Tax=Methanohalophilus profundi TaxID=2138083 RepID=UPI00101CBB6F|nr:methionyl-tRNA formyltransferase [Methanohalophilus profundi]
MNKNKIIIATIKSWNIKNALKFKEEYCEKYDVLIITKKDDLNYETIKQHDPEYIFFPHWSWIIPEIIYTNFECVVFHITDLPYGRGGSPLQNLILRKVYNTKISAIKVEQNLDAGEVYIKKDFYIGLGSAEEIFMEASNIIFEMINYIVDKSPEPQYQSGEPVFFKRRTPSESDISKPDFKNYDDIYDFIRMLDGEGYPKSFLKIGNFKILFSDIHKKGDKLTGRFDVVEDK